MSPALDSNDPMKKSCSALQCNVNLVMTTWYFWGVSFVHCMCPTVVFMPHLPSVQLSAMPLLACCGQGYFLLMGHCKAALSLS